MPWYVRVAASVGSLGALTGRAIAIGGLLVLLLPAGASAQFFGDPGDGLPPGVVGLPPSAVRRLIASQGFRVLVPPFRNGDVYVVDVVEGRFGEQQRLIVDAFGGRILRRISVDARRDGAPRESAPREAAPREAVPRDVVRSDRMPFPGENERRSRRSSTSSDDPENPLFGAFSRPAPDERQGQRRLQGQERRRVVDEPENEPRIVPGFGPEHARPKHLAKPKLPPRAIVRAVPVAPPARKPTVVPAAEEPGAPSGPAVARTPVKEDVSRESPPAPMRPSVIPSNAPAQVAPSQVAPSQVAPAKNAPDASPAASEQNVETPRAKPDQAKPDRAAAAAKPAVVARPEVAQPAAVKPAVVKPGSDPNATASKPSNDSKPAGQPAAAVPAKPAETRRSNQPLNDIPPAPL